jgi:hypothetical protein
MSYTFVYIFCATPFGCADEFQAFQDTLGEFNSDEAMPKGFLFTSLAIVPALADKRPYQDAINYNLRMCRYYVQVIEDSWGPPQRDYEGDWAFVERCIADPELPMREAAILFKAPLLPHKVDPAIVELKQRLLAGSATTHAGAQAGDSPHNARAFDNLEQFRAALRGLFSGWLDTVVAEHGVGAGAG